MALAGAAGGASAAGFDLTGTWLSVYHCEVGWCAGKDFPATNTVTQAPGSNVIMVTNGSESYEGVLEGLKLTFHGGTGSYSSTFVGAVSADGNSWSGTSSDSNGTSGTATAKRQTASAPTPQLAVSSNLAPVSGAVLVRLPGASTFSPLAALTRVPFGATIDATGGRVKVSTARPRGGTQTGEFFEGEFVLSQRRGGTVVASLAGGDPTVCQRSPAAARASARRPSPGRVVRKLWANAHGSFSTRGNYAAGAVAGTEWLTEDLCRGTLIRVRRDRVRVTDLTRHRRLTVRAGHSYLARA